MLLVCWRTLAATHGRSKVYGNSMLTPATVMSSICASNGSNEVSSATYEASYDSHFGAGEIRDLLDSVIGGTDSSNAFDYT